MVFLPGADRLPMRNLQNITDEIKQHAHCTSTVVCKLQQFLKIRKLFLQVDDKQLKIEANEQLFGKMIGSHPSSQGPE